MEGEQPTADLNTPDVAVNPSEYAETPVTGDAAYDNEGDTRAGNHGALRSRASLAHQSDFTAAAGDYASLPPEYVMPPSADPSLRANLAYSVKYGQSFNTVQKHAMRVQRGNTGEGPKLVPERRTSEESFHGERSRRPSFTLRQRITSRAMLTGLAKQTGELSVQDRLEEARRLRSDLKLEADELWWGRKVYFDVSLNVHMFLVNLYLKWSRNGLWRTSIDEVQGIHGSHVGVYFQKMRFVMLLNVVLTALWIGLVIAPQGSIFGWSDGWDEIVGGDTDHNDQGDFVGLFTGGGFLNTTFYFYGAYTQRGIANARDGSPWELVGAGKDDRLDSYDIVTAYISVTLATFLISYLSIFHEIHRAAENGVETAKSTRGEWVPVTVLTSYDHSLTSESSITGMLIKFRTNFKEYAAKLTVEDTSLTELVIRRGLVWIFVLGTLGGTLYGIFLVVTDYSSSSSAIERLYPAIVLTVSNSLIPWIFEIVAASEKYSNENVLIEVTLLRSVILRFVGLLVFFFTTVGLKDQFQCWENYVGQQMYSAFVVGLSAEIFTCLLWDMNTTLLFRHVKCSHLLLVEEAYFDTIGKSLTLLYSQCLVWLGCGFCPMLPVLGIFRNVIMFYVQKWSTMRWCSPRLAVKQFDSAASLPLVIWYLLLGGIVVSCGSMMFVFPNYATSGVKMSTRWHDKFVGLNLEANLDLANPSTTHICLESELVVSNCDICASSLSSSLSSTAAITDRVCWRSDWVDFDGVTNFHFNTSYGGNYSDGVSVALTELCSACPRGCGPFRSHTNTYDVLIKSSAYWDSDFMDVVSFAGTPAFTFLLAVGLLSWMFIVKAQSAARRELNHKLAYQLELQLHDKSHLINLLRTARGDVITLPRKPAAVGTSAPPFNI